MIRTVIKELRKYRFSAPPSGRSSVMATTHQLSRKYALDHWNENRSLLQGATPTESIHVFHELTQLGIRPSVQDYTHMISTIHEGLFDLHPNDLCLYMFCRLASLKSSERYQQSLDGYSVEDVIQEVIRRMQYLGPTDVLTCIEGLKSCKGYFTHLTLRKEIGIRSLELSETMSGEIMLKVMIALSGDGETDWLELVPLFVARHLSRTSCDDTIALLCVMRRGVPDSVMDKIITHIFQTQNTMTDHGAEILLAKLRRDGNLARRFSRKFSGVVRRALMLSVESSSNTSQKKIQGLLLIAEEMKSMGTLKNIDYLAFEDELKKRHRRTCSET
eukprot:PhF_6_TR31235/c0_g1_i1/m.45783